MRPTTTKVCTIKLKCRAWDKSFANGINFEVCGDVWQYVLRIMRDKCNWSLYCMHKNGDLQTEQMYWWCNWCVVSAFCYLDVYPNVFLYKNENGDDGMNTLMCICIVFPWGNWNCICVALGDVLVRLDVLAHVYFMVYFWEICWAQKKNL